MQSYFKQSIARSAAANIRKKSFELSSQDRAKLKNVSEVVLAVAAAAGVMAISVLAPNILQLIPVVKKTKKFMTGLDTQERQRKVIKSFYYLRQNGYIKILPKGQSYEIRITQKGRKKIKMLQLETLSIHGSKVWDKNWWVVLADIPTQDHRQGADLLRKKLKNMSFYPLQRTVWLYPFDPRDELDFISHFYGVSNFVTVMKVAVLDPDDETKVKSFFGNLGII